MNACDRENDKIVVTVPLKVGKFEKKCKKVETSKENQHNNIKKMESE